MFFVVGFLPVYLLGGAMLVGFWGAYKIIKGIIMIMAPKSEPGDVSQE
jgi:hypothetical protein